MLHELADTIDRYVEEHENDQGATSEMDRNALVMGVLAAVGGVLRLHADRQSVAAVGADVMIRELEERGFKVTKGPDQAAGA